jgi:hypothetical protein
VVDQYLITTKVQFGYGKSAQKAGLPCAHYRPISTADPIVSGNPLPPIMALFYPWSTLNFTLPSKYGKPEWVGILDASLVLVGDYVVDPNLGTFFIASLETYLPAYVARCNRALTIGRPGAPPSGIGYYGGDETATETRILTAWPAAVVQGPKGNEADPFARLPGDVKMPWVTILLPSSIPFGVQIRAGDVVTDEQAITQRYIVSSTELTALGYRLTANQETT